MNDSIKGIIAINKPQGWTSFDVVNKIKHMLHGVKVGHLGTLDPMATGVLLVTLGKATKLFDLMQQKTKTYIADFKFGYQTDSLDSTGNLTHQNNIIPTLEQIKSVLPEFVGNITQIPPKFSAKSINGKRAYDLARTNVEFDMKPCEVYIKDLEIQNFKDGVLTIKIVCGSGTYIRALGRDIATKLNAYATMTSLVRTDVDSFNIKSCQQIEVLSPTNIVENIVKIKDVLNLPILKLDQNNMFKILNGQIIDLTEPEGDYMLCDANDVIALIKIADFKAKMSIYLA